MNSTNQMEEEVFSLKFELDSLTDHLINGNHERWVHGFMNKFGEQLHLKRYEFAQNFVKDKTVLDIAGGCGYGTLLISENAKEIHSVDLDGEAVRYANHRYNSDKINRLVDNAETFIKEDFFDVIISFETVEHLKKYDSFLNHMNQSLKKEGLLIISTPIVDKTTTENHNIFHEIEWSFQDFQDLIKQNFTIEDIYVQNIIYNKQIVDSFIKKVLYKLNLFNVHEFNAELLKYSESISMKNVHAGFQILVCKKK